MDVRYMGVYNEQVSAVSANGAEKSESHIDIPEQAFTGASLNGKKLLSYTDDVVNDSSPINLSNQDLRDTTEIEMTINLSGRVDRRTP